MKMFVLPFFFFSYGSNFCVCARCSMQPLFPVEHSLNNGSQSFETFPKFLLLLNPYIPTLRTIPPILHVPIPPTTPLFVVSFFRCFFFEWTILPHLVVRPPYLLCVCVPKTGLCWSSSIRSGDIFQTAQLIISALLACYSEGWREAG